MKCSTCGAVMNQVRTDFPLKVSEARIVILKKLPVLQCSSCREYLIDDAVMQRVDTLLSGDHNGAELEVIPFAA